MNDGNRVYPVNKLILHHAMSPDMTNWTDLQVQDWFSSVGKGRGYQNGTLNPYHEHPGRPGQLTYAQAHYAMIPKTDDDNKYGYRLVELIKRPFQNVAWHAGNWTANQTSIGIEITDNYVSKILPDEALMLISDELARNWDKEIDGSLFIYGHKDWQATACPGTIYDKIDGLVDMINNPEVWNEKLWPTAASVTKPVPEATTIPKKTVITKLQPTYLWDLTTNPNYTSAKTFNKGEEIEVVAEIKFNGATYYQTAWSFGKNKWGLNSVDVIDKPTPEPTPVEPKPDPEPIPEPETPTEPVNEPDYGKENNTLLKAILDLLTKLIEKIGGIFR